MNRIVLFVVASLHFSFIYAESTLNIDWAHVELGGANYGADGHTQASQQMTVARALEVSSKSN